MCAQINKQYQSFVKRVTQEVWERDFGYAPAARLKAFGLGLEAVADIVRMPYACQRHPLFKTLI